MSDKMQTVYIAKDPNMAAPVFATDDFEVISEWVDKHPNRFYNELGVLSAEEVRDLPDFNPNE